MYVSLDVSKFSTKPLKCIKLLIAHAYASTTQTERKVAVALTKATSAPPTTQP